MTVRRGRRTGLLLLSLPTLALVAASLTTPVGALQPTDRDKTPPSSSARVTAERTLDRVERIFAGKSPRADVTLALRDLLRAQGDLSPAEQEIAARYLDRPTDPGGGGPLNPTYGSVPSGRTCSARLCVHWVEKGKHKVAHDGNVKTVPRYVRTVKSTLEHVASTYVGAGYRPVKGDRKLGGNAKPDIYLTDIGVKAYGYCTSDQKIPSAGPYDAWAFCVLDNDYSKAQFPNGTPLTNLRVTAAHEYFHAVQFGYDVFEDAWIMDATATWAEEQVYDAINDNLQYLAHGPMGRPFVPLDTFETGGLYHYGSWVFFQYLTERFVAAQGGMPTLVRDMWRRMDGSGRSPEDLYSMQAVTSTLAAYGTTFGEQFARFSQGNVRPYLTYAESRENHYPSAPAFPAYPDSAGWSNYQLDHLTSVWASFWPSSEGTTAVIEFDLPSTAHGWAAMVTVRLLDGENSLIFETYLVPLDATGAGSVSVPISVQETDGVEYTIVNASTRFENCWSGTPWSCGGTSLDNGLLARVRIASIS